jgi:hypothetical protein
LSWALKNYSGADTNIVLRLEETFYRIVVDLDRSDLKPVVDPEIDTPPKAAAKPVLLTEPGKKPAHEPVH